MGQSQYNNPFNSSNNNINNNNVQVNFNNINNGVTHKGNVHDPKAPKPTSKYKNKLCDCLNHQEIIDKFKYENHLLHKNETSEQQLIHYNNNGKVLFSSHNHNFCYNYTPSNSKNVFISTYCPLKFKINSTKSLLGQKTKRFNNSSEDTAQLITADKFVE